MATRQVKDAKDILTGELIYFTGHAGATYMSDGATVEDVLGNTLKQGGSYYFNDSYENPYLEFTYQNNNLTSYWNLSIYNDKLWLGKQSSEISVDSEGNVNATAFYQVSDVTKKNIIENVEVDVNKIAEAPLVKFTYKEKDDAVRVGTIAQYWKEVLPEVVNGEEGTYTVDYGTLAAINSISLARIIEKQEKRISELEVELENIKTFLQKQGENV